ncbi:GATA transcription factor 5-like [Tripterygium wilfordii]|uniref:GATA transcription factor n=1 Tax=Tripterygium wilfordii TaxID=458696 RepID=A0A7J7DGM2_TRIWF|nr:GATA transcription factor 5-like [Tripterygium wilfordii]KAF5745419.1 GATA transcription factor 5-like [Tripterygium wilfordii]
MEYCVESRALKSSLQREILAMKSTTTTQQAFLEDFVFLNTNIGDDFSVDCFLDFSNGELKENSFGDEEDEEEKERLSVSSQERMDDDNNSNSSTLSGTTDNSDSFGAGEISVPTDELADLEWVSQFVDDSVPEFPLLYPVCYKEKTESHTKNRLEPEPKPSVCKSPCFPAHFPSKARTKRTRATGRVWRLRSPLTVSSSVPCLLVTNEPGFDKPPAKKLKKAPAAQRTMGLTWAGQFQRRCSHCQVQKTPQWRTGPLGPKTLCNACGVRYKSGQLFPEYRPACSPTFSDDIHSNSHRKVLEMRKRKETAEPDSRLNQIVQRF